MSAARVHFVFALFLLVAGTTGPGCSNQDPGQPPMGSIDAPKGDFGFSRKDQDKAKGKESPRLPVSDK
jgi:hypothetical protein